MHKIKYLSVIFFSLFIISCKSAGLPLILGSEKQTIDKIHVEYMNIGDTYLSLQQYDKAIEYYNKAMKNKELYWNCYYKIGKVYALKNQWEEASVYFKKLLERDPENSTLKASLAYIMASNNELLEAKEIYEEIISENQENQLYLENYISTLSSVASVRSTLCDILFSTEGNTAIATVSRLYINFYLINKHFFSSPEEVLTK
jgi:tetratricopeptide (TPR) repeat protein